MNSAKNNKIAKEKSKLKLHIHKYHANHYNT